MDPKCQLVTETSFITQPVTCIHLYVYQLTVFVRDLDVIKKYALLCKNSAKPHAYIKIYKAMSVIW